MGHHVFAPTCKIVTPSEPGNIDGGTGMLAAAAPYIPFDHYQHVTVICGVDKAASTSFTITFRQALDTSGTSVKTLGFTDIVHTLLDGGTYTEAAVTANSYATTATTVGGLYIVEFMSSNLDADGGFDHIQLVLTGLEASNGFFSLMIFDQATHKGHTAALKPVSTFTPGVIS